MSSTSTTQYYGLTQYTGNDKPDFADNNVAFREVDAALHGVVQDAEGFATDITNLQTDVTAAQSDITTLQTDLDTAEADIVVINNKDLAQDAEIARVDTNSKDMITAYNEASATSTHAYAIGDYFIYNNVLYIATAPIAINDTIVPDTNCSTTNVGAELIQLKSDLDKNHKLVAEYINTTSKTNLECFNEILSQLAAAGLNEEQLSDARLILGRTDATRNVARMGRFDTVAGTKIFVSDPYGTVKVVYTGSSNPANRSIVEHAVDGTTTDISSATNSTRWAVYV